MPVKFSVVNEEREEDTPSDYLFDEDRVTIGRGDDNHLTLSDPKRIVSTEHAMVERDGNSYQLIDRGSKNFTYVGNQRVTAQAPYELSDGDVFRIGDFRIEFHELDLDPDSVDETEETVFAHEFANPFEEPADQLIDALTDLAEAYDQEAPQRRDDALAEALRNTDREVETHEVLRHVMDVLGEPSSTSDGGTEPVDTPSSPASDMGPAPGKEEEASSGSTPAVQASDTVADTVIDTLVEAMAEVVRIPWRFRHEFIGQTIMQAPETQFLYDGDGQVIKEHLMDPSLSEEERTERLAYVEEAAEALAVHQVAMLNGYKASVMNGADELLQRLDPDAHEEEVVEGNVLFQYLPLLASPATLDRLRAEWKELQMGEGSVAEKRIFRPAFTKAYLARMTAPGSGDGDTASGP